jgi:hypothetical protein
VKREIQITIETERIIEAAGEIWCAGCGAYTPMLTIEQAAAVARLGVGAIQHWLSGNELHGKPSRTGVPRVCQRSLLAHLKRLNFLPRPKPGVENL